MPFDRQTRQLTTTLAQFYVHPVAQVSLELFLSIGAVVFFALFAIRPTLLTVSDLIKEIEDKKVLDQQLEQKITALNTVQTQYLELQTRLPVLDQAIPESPEAEKTLKTIEKLASDYRLLIESIQLKELPTAAPEATTFAQKERLSYPLVVVVAGDYPTIRAYVEAIRLTRRTMIIDTIVFSSSKEQQNKKLRASITLSIPYYGLSK